MGKRRNYEPLGEKCRPLYESGLSTHAVAARLNVSQPAVRKALEAVSCPLRSQSEALKIIGYGRLATDEQIAAALMAAHGNQSRAAKSLGISSVAVLKRLKKSAHLREVLAAAKAA